MSEEVTSKEMTHVICTLDGNKKILEEVQLAIEDL
tara:strand:- start:107 stop:211 length:105 start_codon:yes stop_codon:yes gene_type:complete